MTKREWLAEKGLAKAGARGKFSTEANAALKAEEDRCKAENIPLPWVEAVKPIAGKRGRKPKVSRGITQFEKSQGVEEEPTLRRQDYSVIVSPPKRREETHAYVVDKNNFVVAIQFCGSCQKSISRCIHDVPFAPAYLGGGLASFVKPEV